MKIDIKHYTLASFLIVGTIALWAINLKIWTIAVIWANHNGYLAFLILPLAISLPASIVLVPVILWWMTKFLRR